MITMIKHKPAVSSILINARAYRYDPTRTTALRTAFVADMNRRFRMLKKAIRTAIVEQDCFGLKNPAPTLPSGYVDVPRRNAFAFPRSSDKIKAFLEWFEEQYRLALLEGAFYEQYGQGVEAAWTNRYVQDAYKRGVLRARYEMGKAGYPVVPIEATGGIAISLSTPFHIDRLGLIYTRVFSELKGITATMDTQISRVLADGIAQGDGPALIARKLYATIDGSGYGTLGITDSLGRYIPAQRRATIMARTEIIRAHHGAMIQEYKNWGVFGIKVLAELATAGDDRVCDTCSSLEGHIYTLEEATNLIPVHPQCRCIALPTEPINI